MTGAGSQDMGRLLTVLPPQTTQAQTAPVGTKWV